MAIIFGGIGCWSDGCLMSWTNALFPGFPRGGDSLEELQPRGKGSRELFWVDILIVGSEGYLVVLSDYP